MAPIFQVLDVVKVVPVQGAAVPKQASVAPVLLTSRLTVQVGGRFPCAGSIANPASDTKTNAIATARVFL